MNSETVQNNNDSKSDIKEQAKTKRTITLAEKNEILSKMDPNSKLYFASVQKYFAQTTKANVNQPARHWMLAGRNQEMRVREVRVYKNKNNQFFYGMKVNKRRDVNPKAPFAGAIVGRHTLKNGYTSDFQYVQTATMAKLLSVNGKKMPTRDELNVAASTKASLFNENDGLVFNGNIYRVDGEKRKVSKARETQVKNMYHKSISDDVYNFNPNPRMINKSQYYFEPRYEAHLRDEAYRKRADQKQDYYVNEKTKAQDTSLER